MAEQSILNTPHPQYDVGLSEELDSFISDLFRESGCKYATFTFPVDAVDPLFYLQQQWNEDRFQYYWENPSQQLAIAAGGSTCRLSAKGANRFTDIKKQAAQLERETLSYTEKSLPSHGLIFVGGFSFNNRISDSIWKNFSTGTVTVPEWVLMFKEDITLLTVTVRHALFDTAHHLREYLADLLKQVDEAGAASERISNPFDHHLPSMPQQPEKMYGDWIRSVTQAKKLIKQEKFEKIVLARKLSLPCNNAPVTAIMNTLRRQYPSCYNFLVHKPSEDTFLGSTPERLGSVRHNTLYTEALAGSIRRGNTLTEDSALGKKLSQSTKNRNEHNFVVKDIEDQLKTLSPRIWRQPQPEIKKLSTVQHLFTSLEAQLEDHTDILDVIERLHPTPAVGGYPWNKAAPYLKDLEQFDRGWYAAPVGWFDAYGDGDFAVAIRSSLIRDTQAYFFAGCGIVADSDPHEEWEETNLKLKPMLTAFYED